MAFFQQAFDGRFFAKAGGDEIDVIGPLQVFVMDGVQGFGDDLGEAPVVASRVCFFMVR